MAVLVEPPIVKESKRSVSSVGSSGDVAQECSRTGSSVFICCYIHKERSGANGGVEVSFGEAQKRIQTNCRIVITAGETKES